MEINIQSNREGENKNQFTVDVYYSRENNCLCYRDFNGVVIPIGSEISLGDFVNKVYNGLSANNTTASTNRILKYGVNVFTTSTVTNNSAKLPQPKTGKSTVIVNNSTTAIKLYPSNIGGRINNYAVDTPAIIPADGKPYTFTCVENPLPGAWVWSPPATTQIVIDEISINHTNGTPSGGFGYSTATLGAASATLDGTLTNLVLTGNWLTENVQTTLINMKTYTNILPTDLLNTSIPNSIQVAIYQVFKPTATTSSFTPQINSVFGPAPSFFAPIGTLNTPAEVGDSGTYYSILPVAIGNNGTTDQLGIGGQFSRAFYTFAFGIPASAATKVYKFKIILEVVQ
jgi:hypothetical protein